MKWLKFSIQHKQFSQFQNTEYAQHRKDILNAIYALHMYTCSTVNNYVHWSHSGTIIHCNRYVEPRDCAVSYTLLMTLGNMIHMYQVLWRLLQVFKQYRRFVSEIWEGAMLVLLIEGMYDVHRWDGLGWHDIHTMPTVISSGTK